MCVGRRGRPGRVLHRPRGADNRYAATPVPGRLGQPRASDGRIVPDAEQHFFVAADSARRIRELYWLQIEQLLPGAGQGYDYSSDSPRSVDALTWAANLHLIAAALLPDRMVRP